MSKRRHIKQTGSQAWWHLRNSLQMAGSVNRNWLSGERGTAAPDRMGANQPQPASHAGHHTATTSDGSCQRAERVSTFEKWLCPVGMAGFEPAASCSQISSIRTLDVAG